MRREPNLPGFEVPLRPGCPGRMFLGTRLLARLNLGKVGAPFAPTSSAHTEVYEKDLPERNVLAFRTQPLAIL
jgi:hypothetical protein